MVSESQVDGRKSRAIRVSKREQITDPQGLTKGMVEKKKRKKKRERTERRSLDAVGRDRHRDVSGSTR